jgi:hypothetical protein
MVRLKALLRVIGYSLGLLIFLSTTIFAIASADALPNRAIKSVTFLDVPGSLTQKVCQVTWVYQVADTDCVVFDADIVIFTDGAATDTIPQPGLAYPCGHPGSGTWGSCRKECDAAGCGANQDCVLPPHPTQHDCHCEHSSTGTSKIFDYPFVNWPGELFTIQLIPRPGASVDAYTADDVLSIRYADTCPPDPGGMQVTKEAR